MDVTADFGKLRSMIATARQQNRRIGCVPTMGAIHAGHLSLVEACRKHVDYVVATIFVNPTQFGPEEDLDKYPRPLEDDLAAFRDAGVDLVFTPKTDDLYPPHFETWVTNDTLSCMLEGEHRPGHFRGVTTIVAKLFNLVQPDVACFGAKDYQQQAILRRMVTDLNFPIEIVIAPTVREADGLALSSRNAYLSAEERQAALQLSAALKLSAERITSGETNFRHLEDEMYERLRADPLIEPQYFAIRDPESLQAVDKPQPRLVALVAAFVGKTRLIDNLEISSSDGSAG